MDHREMRGFFTLLELSRQYHVENRENIFDNQLQIHSDANT